MTAEDSTNPSRAHNHQQQRNDTMDDISDDRITLRRILPLILGMPGPLPDTDQRRVPAHHQHNNHGGGGNGNDGTVVWNTDNPRDAILPPSGHRNNDSSLLQDDESGSSSHSHNRTTSNDEMNVQRQNQRSNEGR